MRVVIVALGSAGDVHPFVAIGRALAGRGHEVAFYTSAWFEEVVRAAGLRFESVQSRERYAEITARPELWHPRKAFPFVMREGVLPDLREGYERLVAETRGGDTVLVCSTLDVAGRLVRDKYGVPLVTAHLAPAVLRTLHRVPVFRGGVIPQRAPRWFKRFVWWLSDRLFDPAWVPEVNALRAELGLPAIRRPLNGWWNSPDRVLGLWPEWFGPTQPDWPPQVRLAGFPFFDRADDQPLDAGLVGWLDDGPTPMVFTHGSANIQAAGFFRASRDVCERLGIRGLLVTAARDDVPERLPPSVRHVAYAPFSLLLPRAAALVCHGGIGTVAQGLRAGVPQLVVPLAHDQLDNASRLVDLGAGRWIDAARYSAERAAPALRELLDEGGFAARARECAQRLAHEDGTAAAVALIEEAARG